MNALAGAGAHDVQGGGRERHAEAHQAEHARPAGLAGVQPRQPEQEQHRPEQVHQLRRHPDRVGVPSDFVAPREEQIGDGDEQGSREHGRPAQPK